jgi:hypothetical protein
MLGLWDLLHFFQHTLNCRFFGNFTTRNPPSLPPTHTFYFSHWLMMPPFLCIFDPLNMEKVENENFKRRPSGTTSKWHARRTIDLVSLVTQRGLSSNVGGHGRLAQHRHHAVTMALATLVALLQYIDKAPNDKCILAKPFAFVGAHLPWFNADIHRWHGFPNTFLKVPLSGHQLAIKQGCSLDLGYSIAVWMGNDICTCRLRDDRRPHRRSLSLHKVRADGVAAPAASQLAFALASSSRTDLLRPWFQRRHSPLLPRIHRSDLDALSLTASPLTAYDGTAEVQSVKLLMLLTPSKLRRKYADE